MLTAALTDLARTAPNAMALYLVAREAIRGLVRFLSLRNPEVVTLVDNKFRATKRVARPVEAAAADATDGRG